MFFDASLTAIEPARRAVVELLDGGSPKEEGSTARTVSRYELVWNAPAWEIGATTSESAGPDDDGMQGARPAQATEPRR